MDTYDKQVVLGSEKLCEGVATSLRFPSQPGSFTPGHYASEPGPLDGQPESPIKTSPVSERIKALEALAAKKKEHDIRGDGGFSHFRDRHSEKSPTDSQKSLNEAKKLTNETPKSPTEKSAPTHQKTGNSVEKNSPESPFEVLGDLRQMNEFEETEEWMKAHLPPVPDLDVVDLIKATMISDSSKGGKDTDTVSPDVSATFAGVPDAFMDSPVLPTTSELKDEFNDAHKQQLQEEESEFDLSFLPTAYIWEQQDKSVDQVKPNVESQPPLSAAPPPAGFESQSPHVSTLMDMNVQQNVLHDKKTTCIRDLDQPEAGELDSSGDSDDTVIEDGVIVGASVPIISSPNDPTSAPASTAPDLFIEEKVTPPPKSERKLMQVPTINVIETDEPNLSEEEEINVEVDEDEDYEIVKDSARDAPKSPEPDENENHPTRRPLETEFMEGYSPPSSPVDSDVENTLEHEILKSLPEMDHVESKPEPEASLHQTASKDSPSDISQEQYKKTQSSNNLNDEPFPSMVSKEDMDFLDNEWSDEAQDVPDKSYWTDQEPIPSIQSKIGVGNTVVKETHSEAASVSKMSFIQDELYDRESFDYDYDMSSPLDEQFLDQSDVPMNRTPGRNIDDLSSLNSSVIMSTIQEPDSKSISTDDVSDDNVNRNSITAHKVDSEIQDDIESSVLVPESSRIPENPPGESTALQPADSFVEFMRECLKSKQDEEPDNLRQNVLPEFGETRRSVSQTPTMVMDLEQEQLTINALKELGSSQEEDELAPVSIPSATLEESSSSALVPPPPSPQRDHATDSMYSKEVEAIDEWVAEAYHLAEHALTAILTHLSVKDLIHWRDPKKSGVVFGVSLLVLLSLAAFSVISVVSYLLLALLCVTIAFRIYKSVVQAVQKSSDGHPFKVLIDKDVSIPPETFRKHVDSSLTYINRALKQMSRLFLVEDLVDSLKLAVVMWLLTYVGAVFNGITILILADILLFAVPPVYEKNKTQIDQYIDVVRTQVNTTMAKLQEKLPGAMKRSKTE